MNIRSIFKLSGRLAFIFLLSGLFSLTLNTNTADAGQTSNAVMQNSSAASNSSNYEIELEPLSIFGQKIYDPVAEPTKIPLNNQIFTEKITKKEIARRAPYNAAELISFISPSILRTNQNRKYKTFFDMRGSRISLALDGFIVQDGSSNSGMRGDDRILEFLSTDIIDSIELMKDSTGLIYGTARGGVVSIKTKRPASKKSQLKLSIGTYSEFSSKFNACDIINNKSSYVLGLNYRNFAGPDGKNASDQNKGLFFKYYNDITKNDNLTLTFNRDIGLYQIPVDEPSVSNQIVMNPAAKTNTYSIVVDPQYGWYYGPWVNTFSDLNYLKTWNKNQSTNLQLSRLEVTNDFHNPRGVGANPVGHIDGHHVLETTTTLALRHTIKTANDIIYRFGYYLDHWYNPTGKLYWENKNNEDKKHSIYAQTEIPIIKDKLTFDAGVRRDKRYIIREEKARMPAGKILTPIINQWEDPRNNYSAGLTYKPNTNDTMSLRYSNIIMTPTDRKATQTGAPLENEKDKVINFGVEHIISNGRTPVTISYNYYKNDMQNAITDNGTVFTDAAKTTVMRIFKNQGTKATGSEIKLSAKFRKSFEASIGAGLVSYTPDMPDKPKKLYNLDMKYAPESSSVEINAYGRYVSAFEMTTSYTYTNPANNQKVTANIPSYKLGSFWDLGMGISKKLDRTKPDSDRVTLSIKNILDKRYETMPLSADYGRRVILGYEMNF